MIQLVQQLYQSVWLVKTKRLLSLVAKGELTKSGGTRKFQGGPPCLVIDSLWL